MLLLWYCTSVAYIMSENSYNLRPRIKVTSRSETRSTLSHEPSPVTRSAVTRSILTGEKGPVPGQHPVPEVAGSVVSPFPGPEMWSRQVFSLVWTFYSDRSYRDDWNDELYMYVQNCELPVSPFPPGLPSRTIAQTVSSELFGCSF